MSQQHTLTTVLTPRLLDLYDVRNSIVVIIDVFRATSTIAAALFNGAKKVIPVDSVEHCIAMGKNLNAITAGERDGKIIPGLQHGNSPAEYHREFVEGKTLVLTTTNGTKLLHMTLAKGASDIVTGSFPNLSAVCKFLANANKNVVLGCSGWKDRFNLEDTLFAGAIVSRLREQFAIHCDSSLMANDMYSLHKNRLHHFIRQTTHWHRLAAYGLEKDLEWCVTEDIADVLPFYQNSELVAR